MDIIRLSEILSTVGAEDRKALVETSLAIELGYTFGLPSCKVDSVVAYFEQFHAEVVKRVIGGLNELYPFSVQTTYNMVVDVYRNRYVLCHEPGLLTSDDICQQLKRQAFEATVDQKHACVLNVAVSPLLRNDLTGYIRRFV